MGNGVGSRLPETYGFHMSHTLGKHHISVVPESSTECMALAGLACGGYSMFRRRKRA